MAAKRKQEGTGSGNTSTALREKGSWAPKIPLIVIDDGDELPDNQGGPVKRARNARKRANNTEEGEDNVDFLGGRTSKNSVTVEQNLMDLNRSSKEFVREFKAKVGKERDNVLTALAQYKQDLHGFHDVHHDELAGVYSSLKTAAGNSNMKDNPLFQQTKQIIHLSRAILKLYQIVDKESQQPKLTVPREAWRQDQKKMDQLLNYGKQHGERLAESIISPAEEHSNDRILAQADMSEAEDIAMGLFGNTRKEAGEGTWGRTAHAQLKALMSVVRTLPLSRDADSQSQRS